MVRNSTSADARPSSSSRAVLANTASRVASNVAIEMGVPRSAIRLEERSTSTLENAEFVARDFSFLRVEIVTDNYHALRARRVFKKKFDDVTVSTVRTRFPIVLWNATREAGALLFYAVTGRL